MNKEFNWETAEYPCLGVDVSGLIICFSSFGVGHTVTNVSNDYYDYSDKWVMGRFKPYTPPKPKTKLWYWELLDPSGGWFMCEWRMSEHDVQVKFIGHQIRKLEALGFIEVEE